MPFLTPRRMKTWLIKLRGAACAEHDSDTDSSELWNRTATPETLLKLTGMALALAAIPDCPHYIQRIHG